MKSACRSQGADGRPCGHFVRFTETQNDRLHAVRTYRGATIQGFLHAAAMKALEEAEQEMRADEEYRERKRAEGKRRAAPKGLGIREHLQAEEERRDARSAALRDEEPPAAPQVIVQTGQAQSAPDAEIDRFAAYVANGPQWNRAERLRESNRILSATAPTPEERNRLAKALDSRIAAIEGKSQANDLFEMVKKGIFGNR